MSKLDVWPQVRPNCQILALKNCNQVTFFSQITLSIILDHESPITFDWSKQTISVFIYLIFRAVATRVECLP